MSMNILFEELIDGVNVGNSEKCRLIKEYAIKQISRCHFEIIDDECIVPVMYKGDMVQVVFTNDISVYEFSKHLYMVGDEPSPKFLHSKIKSYEITFIDMIRAYKREYYLLGKNVQDNLWYKIYSRTPLSCPLRDVYGATWIDYEKQLKGGSVIYDEGICGLWAMPAEMMKKCFNTECKEHYGSRVFIVKPVADCFYLNDGAEIIGDRYEVIDSLSLEDTTDMGVLCNYLLEDEKNNCKKEIDIINSEKTKIRSEINSLYDENRCLLQSNIRLKENRKILFGVGFVAGIVAGLTAFLLFL